MQYTNRDLWKVNDPDWLHLRKAEWKSVHKRLKQMLNIVDFRQIDSVKHWYLTGEDKNEIFQRIKDF
jgi:hypothetical protein